MGAAKLTASKKVAVTENGAVKEYTAKHVIIATGARARELPNLKIDAKNIIGYRDAMTLPSMPKSMVVVGSGAIGIEFAYFYHTMGTKVTVVEYMDNILPREDQDCSKEMKKIYNYLEIPYFQHDFNNVEQLTFENDIIHGIFGEHTIKNKVEPVVDDYEKILGKDQSDRLRMHYDWFFRRFNYI